MLYVLRRAGNYARSRCMQCEGFVILAQRAWAAAFSAICLNWRCKVADKNQSATIPSLNWRTEIKSLNCLASEHRSKHKTRHELSRACDLFNNRQVQLLHGSWSVAETRGSLRIHITGSIIIIIISSISSSSVVMERAQANQSAVRPCVRRIAYCNRDIVKYLL